MNTCNFVLNKLEQVLFLNSTKEESCGFDTLNAFLKPVPGMPIGWSIHAYLYVHMYTVCVFVVCRGIPR